MQTQETQQIIPAIVELVNVWQGRNWPVVCSRFINLPNSNWQHLRDWNELRSEPDTALIPELDDVTPYVFKKGTYSAWSPEISAVCSAYNAHDIVIAGVDTNECVLATALEVFDAGFIPWIVKDACASTGGAKPNAIAIELLSALLGKQQIITKSRLM